MCSVPLKSHLGEPDQNIFIIYLLIQTVLNAGCNAEPPTLELYSNTSFFFWSKCLIESLAILERMHITFCFSRHFDERGWCCGCFEWNFVMTSSTILWFLWNLVRWVNAQSICLGWLSSTARFCKVILWCLMSGSCAWHLELTPSCNSCKYPFQCYFLRVSLKCVQLLWDILPTNSILPHMELKVCVRYLHKWLS